MSCKKKKLEVCAHPRVFLSPPLPIWILLFTLKTTRWQGDICLVHFRNLGIHVLAGDWAGHASSKNTSKDGVQSYPGTKYPKFQGVNELKICLVPSQSWPWQNWHTCDSLPMISLDTKKLAGDSAFFANSRAN
jgi:hypothetical protein